METNAHINEKDAGKFEIFCRIEDEEYKAITWYNKKLGYRSTIKTTEWTAGNIKDDAQLIQAHYQPNKFQRLLLILFAFFWSVATVFGIIELWEKQSYSYLYLLIAFFFITFLIIRQLVNKKMNYDILASIYNIKIQEKYYLWSEISETYIIKRPERRGGTFFLVLALVNGKFLRYNINSLRNMFSNSVENKLAKAIEYYKVECQKFTPPLSPASTTSNPHTP